MNELVQFAGHALGQRILVSVYMFIVAFTIYGTVAFPRRFLRTGITLLVWIAFGWSVIFNWQHPADILVRQSAWLTSLVFFVCGARLRSFVDHKIIWPRRERHGSPAKSLAEHRARGGTTEAVASIPTRVNLLAVDPQLLDDLQYER